MSPVGLQHIMLVLRCVQLFAASWTIACQALLSVEFSGQECWSGLPFHSPGHIPNPGIKPKSLASPALAGKFFTTEPLGKPNTMHNLFNLGYLSMRSDCLSVMKCAHSKGNPHQTPGRQRENHLPSMLLLQRNIDIVVSPLLPQGLLMLTQPPNRSHTSLSIM